MTTVCPTVELPPLAWVVSESPREGVSELDAVLSPWLLNVVGLVFASDGVT